MSKGSKKEYLLHLRDKALEEQLAKDIETFGGKVSCFLTSEVGVVITDFPFTTTLMTTAKKDGIGENAYGDVLCQNCVSAAAAAASASAKDDRQTCTCASGSQKDDIFTRTRKQKIRAEDAKQPKVPPILIEAHHMGVKIVSHRDFLRKLSVRKRKQKSAFSRTLALARRNETVAGRKPKVFRLKEPVVKMEDYSRRYRPIFETLSHWPRINIDTTRTGSVFAEDSPEKESSHNRDSSSMLRQKKRKAARKLDFDQPLPMGQNAGSTGVTLTTGSKVRAGYRQARPGYCELCDINADNLEEHLSSDTHHKNATDPELFKELDEEIGKGPTLEQFVEACLRRTNSDNKGTSSPFGSPKPHRLSASPSRSIVSPLRPKLPVTPTRTSPYRRRPHVNSQQSPHSENQSELDDAAASPKFCTFKLQTRTIISGKMLTDLTVLK